MPNPSPEAPDAPHSRLLLIDAANTLYRAFFAVPPLRNSKGLPTNAVYGFVNMLQKVIRELAPDQLAIVMDAPGKSFRHALYADYKATRDAQPEDLTTQIPWLREIAEAYRIPVLQIPGVEADDVIATIARRAPPEVSVTIVSTDKDLMQLVSDHVELLDTMKDRHYGPAEVEERFGVPPSALLDLRALVGDPSDNIPGVKGIGEKGAAQLIREFGDLESLLARAGEVPNKRAREALLAHAKEARLSKQLATLNAELDLPIGPDALARQEPDRERLRHLFEELEFVRLLQSLGEPQGARSAPAVQGAGAPAAGQAALLVSELRAAPPSTRILTREDELAALAAELRGQELVILHVVSSGEGGAVREEPVGFAFALAHDRAAYLPVGLHTLVSGPGLPLDQLLEALCSVLVGPNARPWGGSGTQRIAVLLGERGLELAAPAFDVELAAFLLDPASPRGTVALATRLLDTKPASWEDLAGRGARTVPAAELPVASVGAWAGAEVCALHALTPLLRERLTRDGLRPLFEEVELPLTRVLAAMERTGVRIDESVLGVLSQAYQSELSRIEGEIFALAGERFQIASPKQLQHILFEKLKLPVVRKTKTGYSTDEAVLEQLAPHHELPARILAHRRLAKLKSTYLDALPPLVNPRTGRVHPTFVQTGAATGRLSCVNPNVQNIPIRTEEGIRIREAFVPAEGYVLVSADYSQVELRILAHFSGDESLIHAFQEGEDIHRRTWAEVTGKQPSEVTGDERARAKAVNFGIIYGSSAFGLANQLGIATADAQATIDAYFARYRGVRRFLDETIETARRSGYVRTLLGRRRYLPDLSSRNRVLRNSAERMAVNTVIQGTAADLIKQAMVQLARALPAAGLRSRMILQVHDELVFEVPKDEEEGLRALVRDRMQAVGPLRVPLRVEIGSGRNWREAH
ncbi:MAG TPA: DNA polymerase I [Myxococcota bacterium]|nr:DNA polymerase I [Myxococcota bacterium]